MSHRPDPYELLGVSPTAADDIIKAAYRVQIRRAHPDRGGDEALAQQVNDAYALLSDPARRAEYDRSRSPRQGPVSSPPPGQTNPQQPAPKPAPDKPRGAPTPTYTDFPRPAVWWKTRLAWIPALAFAGVGLTLGGPLGVVACLVALYAAFWRTRAGIIFGAVASLAPYLLTEVMPTLGIPVVYAVALVFFGVARRKEGKRLRLHVADVFLTTAQRYALPVYEVRETPRESGGGLYMYLRPHGKDVEYYAMPACNWDGRSRVGDYVLVSNGEVLAGVEEEALRLYAKVRG